MNTYRLITLALVSLVALNAQADNTAPAATAHEPDCVDASKLTNTLTPPDLYNALVTCVKQQQDSNAVYLFALAGVYSYFDTLRVSANTAQQTHTRLAQKAWQQLSQAEYDRLFAKLDKVLGSEKELPKVCQAIIHIGPPDYYPAYMIQQGANAATNSNTGNGLRSDFDVKAAWQKAKLDYLHCP